ncbi:MAG: TRAP transporter permease [Trueperaceae bacterium]
MPPRHDDEAPDRREPTSAGDDTAGGPRPETAATDHGGSTDGTHFSIDQVLAEAAKDEGAAEAARMVEEAEAGGRTPNELMTWIIFALALGWSLFQLSIASVWVLDATRARAIHLAFALLLTFLVFPARRRRGAKRIPWYDYLFAIVSSAGVLYLVVDYLGIQTRFGIPIEREVWLGSVTLILLLEATRRSLGPALAIIGGVFLLYAMMGPRGAIPYTLPDLIAHRGYPIDRIISQMYVTTEGVFGVALGVSVQFVFLFVLFGSMLDRAGAGKYFIDLANAFLGVYRGGPAKAAVVASGMTGMVSGSSLANVVTTGTFTIPLMKRAGYPAHKAAGIEVAVSTNGQLMPPVMGAAAFIIAEFTGLPYFDIVRAAFVPAVISFMALFWIVHLEALKLGLEGLPRAQLPSRWRTFIEGIHYLAPLAVLIHFLVIARASPAFAVMWAIVTLVFLMLAQAPVRARMRGEPMWPALVAGAGDVVRGLEAGARNMVGIAVAVATAGMVVGTVNLTGLGLRLTEIIESVANAIAGALGVLVLPIVDLLGGSPDAASNLMVFSVVLVITAIASLILGLGLPTTANYIVMATLTAPVIYSLGQQFGFGFPLLAAHLFVFFFGILADDTPPVGLAAYAAAAIARSNPIKTGIQGFTYDMRTAILPFMFIFNTRLLLFGVETFAEGAWVFLSALLGMMAFGSGTQRYLLTTTRWYEQILLLAVAFMLIQPTWTTDAIGLALVLLIAGSQQLRLRRARAAAGG